LERTHFTIKTLLDDAKTTDIAIFVIVETEEMETHTLYYKINITEHSKHTNNVTTDMQCTDTYQTHNILEINYSLKSLKSYKQECQESYSLLILKPG
jgi:hypothetical protein